MKGLKYLFIAILLSYFSTSAQQDVNIHSYDIYVNFSPYSEEIDVSLTCTFIPPVSIYSQLFIFSSRAHIRSLEIILGNQVLSAEYGYKGDDSLLLTCREEFLAGERYSMKINYSFPAGRFNDTLLYLDRGYRWYPLIMDQVAPFRIAVDVPPGVSVLSAGNLVRSKNEGMIYRYTWESRIPVFKIPVMIYNPGLFRYASGGDIQLYYNYSDSAQALRAVKRVNNFFNYYSSSIGNYPYNKLTLFEIQGFGGANICSGLLMVDADFIKSVAAGNDEMLMFITAQQWFGAGVYSSFGRPGFLFLNISLPHYLRLMCMRSEKGETAFEESLAGILKKYNGIRGDSSEVPLKEIISTMPFNRVRSMLLYTKGPYILSIIEKNLGQENWLNFLRQLYSRYCGKVIDLRDFTDQLPGVDSQSLFEKLVSETGMP